METSDPPAGTGDGGGTDKLRLKVASGNAAGTVIEVEGELVIGRGAAGAGTLANDIEISRQHARIARETDGRYLIEDLGSTNGTHVNGRSIEGPTALEAGDRIEVGASALIVQVSAPPPTPRSTPVTSTSTSTEARPGETAGPPPFTLRIEVDVEAGEATVALDESADEVRLVHEDGRWRLK